MRSSVSRLRRALGAGFWFSLLLLCTALEPAHAYDDIDAARSKSGF